MNKVPRYTAVIERNVIANLGTSSTLNLSTDNTLSPNSDSLLPTQKAVKSYVDNKIGDIELILISINGE